MPLTAVEKNLIAQGGLTAGAADLTAFALLSAPETLGLSLALIPISFAIQEFFLPRQRSPRSNAPELLRQVDVIRRQRGIQGRISRDPFTGADVISTFNQDPILLQLLAERAVREQGRIGVQERSAFDLATRQGVIEGLARTAQERGFPATFDPALRGGVFRPAADQPLRFIEGNFLQ